jgi:ectoine hydroxylase-related dioxygenase (phytanoyl-CoA dioxygenase family)
MANETLDARPISPATQCDCRILDSPELVDFQQQGFLKVTEFCSPTDIAEVRAIIDDAYCCEGRQFGALDNLLHQAPQLRRTPVYRSCCAIAKQLLGTTTRYVCDQALYKEPHGKHGTPWHQDGVFHGQYPNNTVVFWIPLQHVTTENGCLHFIPLRNRTTLLPHRPLYPNDYRSLMTDHVDASQAVACPLFIGEATVHGPLTPHMALANHTDFIRRTWTLTFTPWGQWGFLTPSRLLNRARTLAGWAGANDTRLQQSP